MTQSTQIFHQLADREGIRDCLIRYARGIDRRDRDTLAAAYWPDATDDHILYNGSAAGFIEWILPLLHTMEQSMHLLGNVTIDLQLPLALTETYFLAYHLRRVDGSGDLSDQSLGGRYLDTMEKRGDEWRIAKRKVIIDWITEYPSSNPWNAALPGVPFRTNIAPGDLSYSHFNGSVVPR
jgi:hypothetical protein